jgi:pilus assembly protein CpaC
VGELPVLGALFRSTNYESDKTELVFVVTPRLAKPLPKSYPLPTDNFHDVNEGVVYATGNMEGSKPAAPAAPASAGAAAAGTAPVVIVPPSAAMPATAPVSAPGNLSAPDAAPVSNQTPSPGGDSAPQAVPHSGPIALETPAVSSVRATQIAVSSLPEPPVSPAGLPDTGSQHSVGSDPGRTQHGASPPTPTPTPTFAANTADPPHVAVGSTRPETQASNVTQ